MEIHYQFEAEDIGPILRANRYGRNLRRFVLVVFLTFFPSLVVLWAVGLSDLAVGAFVAAPIFIAALHLMLRQMAKKTCLGETNQHRLEVAPNFIHYEAPGRWFRFDGSWVTSIDCDDRYLYVRRATQVGVVPLRALESPDQQQQLIEELRTCVEHGKDSSPAAAVFRSPLDEGDPVLLTIEFHYSPAECLDLEIHRFESKTEGAVRLPRILRRILSPSLLLMAVLWMLTVISNRWKGETVFDGMQRSTPAVGILVALALPLTLIRPLEPLRRKLLGQLGDEERGPQLLELRRSGLSHGSDRFQSHVGWTHVQRLLNGRDYIVFFGDLGGWSAVPRRAFASEDEADAFAQLAERLYNDALNEQQEKEAPKLPLPAEDGNPYTPPMS